MNLKILSATMVSFFSLSYSSQILSKSDDLKTNACTTDSGLPPLVKAVFPLLSEEVITRYYGCGIVVPDLLEGCAVLDLGCGAGRDCYIISKLVGPTGLNHKNANNLFVE